MLRDVKTQKLLGRILNPPIKLPNPYFKCFLHPCSHFQGPTSEPKFPHEFPPFQIPTAKHVYSKDRLFYHCTLALVLRVLLKWFSAQSRLPFLAPNPPYLFVTLFKGRSDWRIKKISHFIQRKHLMKFCSLTWISTSGTKYL